MEANLFDWVTQAVERGGYFGISLLMLAENIFPPIPSEIIMPLAGFVAARGQLTLFGVVLAGTIGSLAGALFWYGVGRLIGPERLNIFSRRHGRWLTLEPSGDRPGQRLVRAAGGRRFWWAGSSLASAR